MRIHHSSLAAGLLLSLGAACTDSGLYSTGGNGPGAPDRATFEGTVCVPAATGDTFPVKVLFAVQGGAGVPSDTVGAVVDALSSVTSRFNAPSVKFGLVGFHTVATGLQGGFADANTFQTAITRYASYQEQGPVSLRAPIRLAQSLLSGDMLSTCPGAVARTRYLVVLLVFSGDTTCNNLNLNLGLDDRCTLLLSQATPDPVACSRCELTVVTSELAALAEKYRAGEVTVQPIYVRTTDDVTVSAELADIAKAGGTKLLATTAADLTARLNAVNYGSLQRQLSLKRLVAFNRNVLVRDGKALIDSDGDGISDDDEKRLGLDPLKPDTDDDGLMDGVELRMGLDPLVPNVINGCNPYSDSDGDSLHDCEERVLGTSACEGDTDSDGLPDLVEVLSGSNPLVAEDLLDSDRDGHGNIEEVLAHTDPQSADAAFRVDHGYNYVVTPTDPTVDGRACYLVRVSNVGLVQTLERPDPPFANIPAGTNDVFLYMQSGRDNDPRGAGVSSLKEQKLRLISKTVRDPAGTIQLAPEDFVTGL